MSNPPKTRDRALEDAVARAMRDNLPPLQRTLEDLQQAFGDLVAACSSARPTHALPAMLRAQATAASLTASLSVLSSFISGAMQRHEREMAEEGRTEDLRAVGVTLPPPEPAPRIPPGPSFPTPMAGKAASVAKASIPSPAEVEEEEPYEEVVTEDESQAVAAEPEAPPFDLASLPKDEQDLHKRANRVAKVSMQDIKMLKPEDVRRGREHKDLCVRLRGELDKARREYDRRFQKILEHPVDYFHHWMVEILADGDPEALGEYPYPSPVLRR